MRVSPLLCVSILSLACDGSFQSPIPPAPVPVLAPAPSPAPLSANRRVIEVGQTVEDLNVFVGGPQAFFRVIMPVDGLLVVRVTWKVQGPYDHRWYYMTYDGRSYGGRGEIVAKLPLTAGHTFDFSVDTCCPMDWDFGSPFVLTTGIE